MQRTPGPGGRARATSEFARRARERMARGEPLTIAIGGTEVVLPPELRQPVLAVLEGAAAADGAGAGGGAGVAGMGGGTGAGGGAGDEQIDDGPQAGGLPPLPLDLPAELTAGQAADLLGISRAALAHLIDAGDLAARTDGPRRRVATADVLAVRDRVRRRRTASVADVVAASRALDLYPPTPPPPAPGGATPSGPATAGGPG